MNIALPSFQLLTLCVFHCESPLVSLHRLFSLRHFEIVTVASNKKSHSCSQLMECIAPLLPSVNIHIIIIGVSCSCLSRSGEMNSTRLNGQFFQVNADMILAQEWQRIQCMSSMMRFSTFNRPWWQKLILTAFSGRNVALTSKNYQARGPKSFDFWVKQITLKSLCLLINSWITSSPSRDEQKASWMMEERRWVRLENFKWLRLPVKIDATHHSKTFFLPVDRVTRNWRLSFYFTTNFRQYPRKGRTKMACFTNENQ